MRRQLSLCAVFGLSLVVLLTGAALAQYGAPHAPPYGGYNPSGLVLPSQPLTSAVVLARFAIDLVAGTIGFLVGAFFSPLLRPFRRIAFFILIAAAFLYAMFGSVPIADWMTSAVAFFAFCVAAGYGIRLGARALGYGYDRPTSFGSAKWATEDYLREHGLLDGKGFLLGGFAAAGQRSTLRYNGERHLLTVAPTRSGKGVSSIIPNLLTYDGSAFVIDPKGENALITAIRRGPGNSARRIAGLGQAVYLLDPWNIAARSLGIKPACVNPLDWIKADDPDAAENAFLLADALVSSESQRGEDRFWDEEAKALLTGLILYVATSKKEASRRNLGRVRDILMLDDGELNALLRDMHTEPHPLIASTAARTAGKDLKLRSNVLASAQSHTHFLDSPRIRDSLSRTDFRFEDLKTKPMTVYLILPADRLKTFDRWLRLLIQQAITVNARNIERKPDRPVLFLLDEMASLGRLSMVEQAFSLMAGFGMQLWGIVQDLSQLERIYDKGWQTFISNSGVIQYFGSRDKMTAEYFSTLCGVTTVRSRSLSYAIGKVFGRSSSSTSSGMQSSSTSGTSESQSHTGTSSFNESQRQLAYPDELMVLKEDEEIVFIENLDPICGEKLRWYKDDTLRALGVNLRPELEEAESKSARLLESPKAQAARSSAPTNAVQDIIQRATTGARSALVTVRDEAPTDPFAAPVESLRRSCVVRAGATFFHKPNGAPEVSDKSASVQNVFGKIQKDMPLDVLGLVTDPAGKKIWYYVGWASGSGFVDRSFVELG